jgi:hypothetical protein
MSADVLRETAVISGKLPKDFIPRFEFRVVPAGRFHSAGDVRSEYRVTWP